MIEPQSIITMTEMIRVPIMITEIIPDSRSILIITMKENLSEIDHLHLITTLPREMVNSPNLLCILTVTENMEQLDTQIIPSKSILVVILLDQQNVFTNKRDLIPMRETREGEILLRVSWMNIQAVIRRCLSSHALPNLP